MTIPLPPLLVVDDVRNMRLSLEVVMADEGYQARSAESAEQALRVLEQEEFFMIITDARLGDRFVQLRKEIFKECFPASALITVTGLARPGMLIEIQGIGVIGDNCSNEKPCTKK